MIRHVCLLILTYAALLLDADVASWSLPAGTAPCFLFLTSAIALLMLDGAGAIWWAVVIGVLTDSLSHGLMGLNVVVLANLAFFAQIFGIRDLRDSAFASGAVVWGFVTTASFSCLTLRLVLLGEAIDLRYLAMDSAGRAGGSAVVVLVVLLSWRMISRTARLVLPSVRVGREKGGWARSGA